jgi:transcriptional regulator with XRE-family HTH domain
MGAKTIGRKLTSSMRRQGLSVEELAAKTGRRVDHVEAVLKGYPNSRERRTQLDTVDEIAGALGLKLDLSAK